MSNMDVSIGRIWIWSLKSRSSLSIYSNPWFSVDAVSLRLASQVCCMKVGTHWDMLTVSVQKKIHSFIS